MASRGRRRVIAGLLFSVAMLWQAQPMPPLNVVSYNLRYGTANDGENAWPLRRSALLQQIGDMAPDVLGVQEALAFQIQEITAEHGYFASFGVGRDDGVADGEHSSILYRRARLGILQGGTFWLSDTPDQVASKTWGNNITRICTYALFQHKLSNRRFWVFNAHLDHQSQPSREKSAALIVRQAETLANGTPVLVLGDFNAGESNAAIKTMLAGGFLDTFRVLHPAETAVGTFSGFTQPGTDKIDYVFASKGWTVQAATIRSEKIGGRYPSDHFPVTARLAIQ